MLVEATDTDFDALIVGRAPRNLRLDPDSPIAPPEVLRMLAGVAAHIRPRFEPAAWMIVEDGEVIGLCSVTAVPRNGDLQIGYGLAPSRQGRGAMSRAIGELLEWACGDPRIATVSAETSVGNLASRSVLERNGFVPTGTRVDAEDGPLICWQVETA